MRGGAARGRQRGNMESRCGWRSCPEVSAREGPGFVGRVQGRSAWNHDGYEMNVLAGGAEQRPWAEAAASPVVLECKEKLSLL